ncbi:MAG: AAA family ATPase [Chloroflexi bacterium]|nr:AAA family ATPase [Chloroflexota bacterium]
MENHHSYSVPVDRLRWTCDPEQFTFQCTDELTSLEEFVGQERAIKAIEFGLSIDKPGYNLFVTGLTGTGKMSVIQAYLQKVLAQRQAKGQVSHIHDWCYVYNFTAPDRPLVITLPKGKGSVFCNQMDELRQVLIGEIGKAFTAKEYAEQRDQVVGQGQRWRQQLLAGLEEQARQEGFVLHPAPTGIMVIPTHPQEARPLTQEEFASLDNGARQAIATRQAQLMSKVEAAFEKANELERATAEEVKKLDVTVAEVALRYPFQKLLQEYQGVPAVANYLEGLRKFALDNVSLLRAREPAAEAQQPAVPMPISPDAFTFRDRDPWLGFKVNVLVDNSQVQGVPIIMETHPTYSNLFGKIERRAQMGTYLSDHTMIKPGAVALANGGYLIVNIRDVLLNPASWEGMKRVIKNRELRIEDPAEFVGMVPPVGLKPEPIQTDVKIIVTGDTMLYDMLSQRDEDFWEIFKVKADFDVQIDRTSGNMQAYACVLSDICRREGLVHLERDGVAKVLEYAARVVADQGKLSSRFGQIKDVVVEAGQLARDEKTHGATAEHIRRAIEAKVYRSSLLAQRIRDLMREDTIIVDTEGSVVGQVNGLVVFDMGDFSFGAPSRITAKTFMGRRGVINIERESQLSGRIHDKGVLILSGYLGWKYAQDKPLTLSASICFEQSYQGVEGDSASSSELYAVLSSLANLPIKQSIAVTGSVNQKGELQPIGGVNQKIEGFFDLCREKVLTGEQGVLIPQRNVRNLMLREDVVDSVRKGEFHVWAASTIDEGIEILTGVPAGRRSARGTYARGTVNYRVDRRLREMAEGLREYAPELLVP